MFASAMGPCALRRGQVLRETLGGRLSSSYRPPLPWRRICAHSALAVLALCGAALLLIVVSSASSYRGYCFQLSFFGDSPPRACSRADYMAADLSFSLEIFAIGWWWMPLAAFALFVVVRALVSLLRRESPTSSR
jgi:hypothetical protein